MNCSASPTNLRWINNPLSTSTPQPRFSPGLPPLEPRRFVAGETLRHCNALRFFLALFEIMKLCWRNKGNQRFQ